MANMLTPGLQYCALSRREIKCIDDIKEIYQQCLLSMIGLAKKNLFFLENVVFNTVCLTFTGTFLLIRLVMGPWVDSHALWGNRQHEKMFTTHWTSIFQKAKYHILKSFMTNTSYKISKTNGRQWNRESCNTNSMFSKQWAEIS